MDNFLESKHLQEFRESAIPDEWAIVNFYSISDPKQIAQWLGWRNYLHTPGWIAQGIDAESGEISELGQFKPDSILEFPDGSKAKYLTQKKGYDAFLPVHPTEIDFWQSIKDDTTRLIRITEGAKKAIASTVSGVPTIGLCGVEMGCSQGRVELVPNLKPFINQLRPIEIAFDADIIRKPAVADALRAFGIALRRQGAREISVRIWDEKFGKGVDDVIAAEHDFESISQTLAFGRWLELHFIKKKQAESDAQKARNPLPANDFAVECSKLFKEYRFDNQYQEWLHYENGKWSNKQAEDGIKKSVFLEAESRGWAFSHNYIKGVVELMAIRDGRRFDLPNPDLLPLKNGVLNLKTKKLLPHEPSYNFKWQLPYDFEEDKTCPPVTEWLLESLRGKTDQVKLVQCYLAAIIRGKRRLQKFLEVNGPPGTGKSVLMSLAIALTGIENVHRSSLPLWEGSQFETACSRDKRLVCFADEDRYTGSVGNFKNLTGTDPLRYERKWANPENVFYPSAMVLLTANERMQFADKTGAIGRRRIGIRFENKVSPSQQKNLLEWDASQEQFTGIFADYLPGILNWVLEVSDEDIFNYLKRTDEFVVSLNQERLETLVYTNNIADWVNEKLVYREEEAAQVGVAIQNPSRGPGESIFQNAAQWLYANYTEFCKTNGIEVFSLKRWKDLVLNLFNHQLNIPNIFSFRDAYGSKIKGIRIRQASDSDRPFLEIFLLPPPDDPPPDNPPPDNPPPDNPPGLSDIEKAAKYGCDISNASEEIAGYIGIMIDFFLEIDVGVELYEEAPEQWKLPFRKACEWLRDSDCKGGRELINKISQAKNCKKVEVDSDRVEREEIFPIYTDGSPVERYRLYQFDYKDKRHRKSAKDSWLWVAGKGWAFVYKIEQKSIVISFSNGWDSRTIYDHELDGYYLIDRIGLSKQFDYKKVGRKIVSSAVSSGD